jgi:hypothetical protein
MALTEAERRELEALREDDRIAELESSIARKKFDPVAANTGPATDYAPLDLSPAAVPAASEYVKSQRAKRLADVPYADSALKGVEQGMSMGFSDEAVGGLQGLYDYATTPDLGLGDAYTRARDAERQKIADAEEANPYTYLGGQLAGGIGGAALTPGLAVAGALKGAPLLTRAAVQGATGAASGAVAGAGASTADDLGGVLSDAATGAEFGGVVGGGMPLVGAGLAKAGKGLGEAGRFLVSNVFNTPKDIISRYSERTSQVDASKGLGGFSDFVKSLVKKASQDVGQESRTARQRLTPSPVDLSPVTKHVDDEIARNIQADGTVSNDTLDEFLRYVKGKITPKPGSDKLQTDVRSLLDAFDDKIGPKWDAKQNKSVDESLKQIRGLLNVELKASNPAYRIEMEEVARKTGLLDTARKAFLSKSDKANPDLAQKKLKSILGAEEGAEGRLGILSEFGSAFGIPDLLETGRDALAQDVLKKSRPMGSRAALLGATIGGIGGAATGPVGLAAGALAGAAIDRFGGQMAKGTIKAGKVAAKVAAAPGTLIRRAGNTKYGAVLQDAAKRGGQAVAATHYVLSQTDPDYQALQSEEESD